MMPKDEIREASGPAWRTALAAARRYWAPLLIAVCINAIVLANSIRHNPEVGYDVLSPDGGHLTNMQIYPFRFPDKKTSAQYFSAPLSYLIPSLYDKLCMSSPPGGSNPADSCLWADGKFAQVLNLLLSVGITIVLWKICERLRPGSASLKASTLALVGILTVYYRTFSQARPEPYVAFFACLVMLQILDMLVLGDYGWAASLRLGAALGLLILSRQWGFFVLPALAALVLVMLLGHHGEAKQILRAAILASVVAALIGGWFYLHLYRAYGTLTAFNRRSSVFSISNQPPQYYFDTGIGGLQLFTSPVRPTFGDHGVQQRLLPTFYSDVWGDYWCYFTCVRTTQSSPTIINEAQVAALLGRVNLVSLYPTLLLLAAAAYGGVNFVRSFRRSGNQGATIFSGFLFAFIACSLIGYVIFQIMNSGEGTTNKATYSIQIFMALPVLGGLLLEGIRDRHHRLYAIALAALAAAFILNLPAYFSNWH